MLGKILISILLSLCLVTNSFAWGLGSGWNLFNRWYSSKQDRDPELRKLPSGLTFYKDFTKSQSGDANSLNAEFALGSHIATFTASRSATTPATYVDSNGVIQLVTTSNIPRIQGGYYDATGFHAGNSRPVGDGVDIGAHEFGTRIKNATLRNAVLN